MKRLLFLLLLAVPAFAQGPLERMAMQRGLVFAAPSRAAHCPR